MEVAVHALLTADKVIEEKNGKKSVIGIFRNINLPKFPHNSPSPWYVFVSFTNVSGKHSLTVNMAHDESVQVIISVNGEIESKRPADDVDVILEVSPVFPSPGNYTITVNLDGGQIASRVIVAQQIADKSN